MSDDFFGFLSSLSIGSDFTTAGILDAIERNRQVRIEGGLTRDQFIEKVFFVPDLASLPVGHLADHRIRMTIRLSMLFSKAPRRRIEQLLRRMLCVSSHPEAKRIVADALHLDVAATADTLVSIRGSNDILFRNIVSGNHGDAITLVEAEAFPKAQREAARSCVADMLLFYAMFEVQLIAARARAIDRFRTGMPAPHGPVIASDHVNDMTQLVKAVGYYQHKRTTGRFPRGKPPTLADPRLMLLALQLGSASGRTFNEIEEDLADAEPVMAAAMVEARAALDGLEASKQAKNVGVSTTRLGQREHASTMFEGVGAGVQLAFAVLRLLNLRDRRYDLVRPRADLRKIAFRSWSDAKLPRKVDEGAERILMVVRAVLQRDIQAGQAFDRRGNPTPLMPQLDAYHRAGTTAGQDLFKSAKEGWPGTAIRSRAIVAGEFGTLELENVQRVDILPDYRLQISTGSPPTNRSDKPRTKRHVQNTAPRYQIVKRSRSHPVKPQRQ